MTLLRRVVSRLEAEDVPFAVIGAAAMAVHGVSRSTGRSIPLATAACNALTS